LDVLRLSGLKREGASMALDGCSVGLCVWAG